VFAFGNENRVDPVMRSEAGQNFDFSVNKFFDVTEKVKLKFSTEVFDLFNHAQFAIPNSNLSSPGFGRVGQQSNLPRTIQFALRLTF
jgi:FAD synthase